MTVYYIVGFSQCVMYWQQFICTVIVLCVGNAGSGPIVRWCGTWASISNIHI